MGSRAVVPALAAAVGVVAIVGSLFSPALASESQWRAAGLSGATTTTGDTTLAEDLLDTGDRSISAFDNPLEAALQRLGSIDICELVRVEASLSFPRFADVENAYPEPGILQQVVFIEGGAASGCVLLADSGQSVAEVGLAYGDAPPVEAETAVADYAGYGVFRSQSGGTVAHLGDSYFLWVRGFSDAIDDTHLYGELPLLHNLLDAWAADRMPTLVSESGETNAVSVCREASTAMGVAERDDPRALSAAMLKAPGLLAGEVGADPPTLQVDCRFSTEAEELDSLLSLTAYRNGRELDEAVLEFPNPDFTCGFSRLGAELQPACSGAESLTKVTEVGTVHARLSVEGSVVTEDGMSPVTLADADAADGDLLRVAQWLGERQLPAEVAVVDPRVGQLDESDVDPSGIVCDAPAIVTWSIVTESSRFAFCEDFVNGRFEVRGVYQGADFAFYPMDGSFDPCTQLGVDELPSQPVPGRLCVNRFGVEITISGTPPQSSFREYPDVTWMFPGFG